ncbi:2-iminoacetate synthase ThiH [Chitinophaga silvatica]|nr:2-iminoacetate synthase ThiH [Chitinophaga silvatica]
MFKDLFEKYNWAEVKTLIHTATSEQVEAALKKEKLLVSDFAALVSPAAAPYLEEMISKSSMLTRQRFGNTMQLYIPMYLSNECKNICTYCGFSLQNKVPRKTLSDTEIMQEVAILKKRGFDHLLLVTGEDGQMVGMPYFRNAIKLLRPHFAQISIEVQPLEAEEYQELSELGVHTVLVYQETYKEEDYKLHHPKGRKSNFHYRLETPDRIGKAGIHKIGLGVLIGLEDWRTDSFFTALHLSYLEKTYWKTRFSISFPRLRPFSGGLAPKVEMSDRELVQLICAYRLFNPDVELSISTRESARFRNLLSTIGITSMSAGSRTNPGGYSIDPQSLEQFEISDERSVEEVIEMLKSQGLQPVYKDWTYVW